VAADGGGGASDLRSGKRRVARLIKRLKIGKQINTSHLER
jgi:hypothetical protein